MNELVKSNLYLIHMDDELYHHGIKGMKWGVRRYQNPDGTLTEEGKKRKRRRLIAAGVIIAGAAALTIGAIAAGSASRNLNAGRKIMANENVRNTAVSSIPDASSAISNSTGRKRYGLFSVRRNDGTRSSIHRTYGDYDKGTYYSPSPALTTWFSTSSKAKTKDGRVINDLYVTAPWSTTARSTGRKVTKTAQTASSAASSSAKKAKEFWPKDPSKRKGPKTPLDRYDAAMRRVRSTYDLPGNRNRTDALAYAKSQLDEYAAFNKRAGRGGPHKLIPRTRYQYGYGMPFDEVKAYGKSPSNGLRSIFLRGYAHTHGGHVFH